MAYPVWRRTAVSGDAASERRATVSGDAGWLVPPLYLVGGRLNSPDRGASSHTPRKARHGRGLGFDQLGYTATARSSVVFCLGAHGLVGLAGRAHMGIDLGPYGWGLQLGGIHGDQLEPYGWGLQLRRCIYGDWSRTVGVYSWVDAHMATRQVRVVHRGLLHAN